MSEKHYIYHGPVYNTFNNLIEERWYGETTAPTKEKALSNLKYRFRQERDIMTCCRLYLDPHRLSVADKPVRLKEPIEEKAPAFEQLSMF